MTERDLIDPTPELPDDTPIKRVRFPTRIRNVLVAAAVKTVGEVRETTDKALLSFPDLGPSSIKHLGESLGLPSRPMESGRASRAGHAETKWLRIDPDEPVSGLGPLATSGRQKIQAGR